MPSKQNNRNYSSKDHKTWSYLYSKQLINLQDKATPDFFQNLALLKLPEHHIPALSKISNALEAATSWEVVEVDGLITGGEFFDLLANKKFPSTTYIRSDGELGMSKVPDIFHELFGHVPMLMNIQHSHHMQQFGKLGLSLNARERALLQRVYWFIYEVGLMNTTNGVKIMGASLLSSFKESTHVFSNNIITKPFSLIEVLRTPYRDDIMPSIYFTLNSFDEIFDILDDVEYLKNAINEASYEEGKRSP
jgi:phenylalanine-4-hydroxylase